LKAAPPPSDVQDVIEWLNEKLQTIPLLIFDQFNDYQSRHRARFLDSDNRWITAEKLAGNPSWAMIAALIASHRIHCLFVTRDQIGSGSFAFVERTPFPLERLETGVVEPLLTDLTLKGVSNRGNGWTDLIDRLAVDLEADGSVLPYRMMMAFRGLRKIPALTIAAYEANGGLPGLEALFLEGPVKFAADHTKTAPTPMTAADVLAVLKNLIGHGNGTQWRVERELIDQYFPESVKGALEYLEAKEFVRQSKSVDGEGKYVDTVEGRSWALDNAHLHPVVTEAVDRAQRRANPWVARLRSSFEAYENAGGKLPRDWTKLLPPLAQLDLAYNRLRGRFRYGEFGGYARTSLLRFLDYIFLCLFIVFVTWWGYRWYIVRTDAYQIRLLVNKDPANKLAAGAAQSGEPYAREVVAGWSVGQAFYNGLPAALKAASKFPTYELDADPRVAIAEALGRAGDMEQAKSAWESAWKAAVDISDVDRRCVAMADVACRMAEAKSTQDLANDHADEATKLGEEQAALASTLPAVLAAKAQVRERSGHVSAADEFWQEALGLASKITSAPVQRAAYVELARKAASAGNSDVADRAFASWSRAAKNAPKDEKPGSLELAEDLAARLALVGRFPAAGAHAERIADPYHKVRALVIVGRALIAAGQRDKVGPYLEKALETVEETKPRPAEYCRGLAKVSELLFLMGRKEESHKKAAQSKLVAQRVSPNHERDKARAEIASALVRVDQVDKGIEMSCQFLAAQHRAEAMASVFRELAHTPGVKPGRKALDDAIQAASAEDMSADRLHSLAFAAVVKGQARLGDIKSACDASEEECRRAVDKLDAFATIIAVYRQSQAPLAGQAPSEPKSRSPRSIQGN
jgi:tetratricopeptide (TPR) repeat protein